MIIIVITARADDRNITICYFLLLLVFFFNPILPLRKIDSSTLFVTACPPRSEITTWAADRGSSKTYKGHAEMFTRAFVRTRDDDNDYRTLLKYATCVCVCARAYIQTNDNNRNAKISRFRRCYTIFSNNIRDIR